MFQENEVISCILMVGVVLFVLVNYRAVIRIPHSGLLLSALLFILLFNIFTICEGIWTEAFYFYNLLEHVCYVVSMFFLALWCRAMYRRGGSGDD